MTLQESDGEDEEEDLDKKFPLASVPDSELTTDEERREKRKQVFLKSTSLGRRRKKMERDLQRQEEERRREEDEQYRREKPEQWLQERKDLRAVCTCIFCFVGLFVLCIFSFFLFPLLMPFFCSLSIVFEMWVHEIWGPVVSDG